MKRLLTILLLFVAVAQLSAQTDTVPPLPEGDIHYSLKNGWVCQNGDTLTEQQYLTLTSTYCPQAHQQYLAANRLATIGKWTMVAGVPCTILGVAFFIWRHDGTQAAAYTLTAAGGALLATGIPLYAAGITRKKQSVATFNLCASLDGVGLSLNF